MGIELVPIIAFRLLVASQVIDLAARARIYCFDDRRPAAAPNLLQRVSWLNLQLLLVKSLT